MKNLISQTKSSIESLANKVEQVENRVSGMEWKVEEVDQLGRDSEKNPKKIWMGHVRPLGYH
jgi:hypothetical protein